MLVDGDDFRKPYSESNIRSQPIYFTSQMKSESTVALIATTSPFCFIFYLISDRNLGIDEVYNRHRASRTYTVVHSRLHSRKFRRMTSLAMNSVTNLLCFVLGAAATAAFVALLLPSAPCPYTIADVGISKLSTVRTYSLRKKYIRSFRSLREYISSLLFRFFVLSHV